ncbi:MAG: hypothetical protein LBQ88_08905 [Treponema sp.]|nr:hypothetical protein [Treponema sp.]
MNRIKMTNIQKKEVKKTARNLYRDRRISLKMAIWAMKNAGYTRGETSKWLGLEKKENDK